MSRLLAGAVTALLVASPALAQGGAAAPPSATGTPSTSAGASIMSASSSLKLAKNYTASTFMTEWEFYTDNDPTGGYVNYVSASDAANLALAGSLDDGSFVMRADAENKASGRGRNSVRISSKAKFKDGVYILDMNHMPVGCGTWPAFWTTTETGWPAGGEIDIIEGANALPLLNSDAYNATVAAGLKNSTIAPLVRDVSSLHTSDNCMLDTSAYMTGDVGSSTCSAYLNGNSGCGVELAGESLYGVDSFGAGVNSANGGWYAMWRDISHSGGVYIYYWPRNSPNVPDDVRNPGTLTTDVANWGQPGANLSVPSCRGDFNEHTIVFDLTFCGDYAGATYGSSGCPSVCTSFVQNNPAAFAEAYWSINSLRVYTPNGKAIESTGLPAKYIAAIVVAVAGAAAIAGAVWWRYRSRMRMHQRNAALAAGAAEEDEVERKHAKARSGWAMGDMEDRSAVPVPKEGGRNDRLSVSVVPYSLDGDAHSRTGLNVPSSMSRKSSTYSSGDSDSGAGGGGGPGTYTPYRDERSPAGSRRPSAFGLAASGGDPKKEGLYGGKGGAASMYAGGRKKDGEAESGAGKKDKRNLIATSKPRTGRTVLGEGKTARHHLDGETRHGHYHDELDAEAERRGQGAFSSRSGVNNSFIG